MKRWKQFFLESPQALMVTGFAGLIFMGAGLLLLPWAHVPGRVSPLNALFTSASAVCVTGLTVVETGSDYTLFGQIVILLLIQAGGLGVMTFAAIAALALSGRLSFRSQAVLADLFFQRDLAFEIKKLFKKIIIATFAIEGSGALIIFAGLAGRHAPAQAFFFSVFHSVSAFCNAGFSLYSDNLIGLRGNLPVIWTIMVLIVLGGIGYSILVEFWNRLTRSHEKDKNIAPKWSFHFRTAMLVTGALLLLGFVALLIAGMTPEEKHPGEYIMGALFQSVTSRTAGFNSVDIGKLPLGSLLFLTLLMFIGGSPGSCAGGVKTTSLAIWLARLRCRLSGRSDTVLLKRTVPVDIVRRVSILIGLALLWNGVGVLLLALSEHAPGVALEHLVFEQISAFGTVGLSTGLTPKLSAAGRAWIILTMYVGRLGPLTLAMWMIPLRKEKITYPEGRIMIG